MHPRTLAAFEKYKLNLPHENITICEPLGFKHYIELQKKARLVLSDSGTISEEASILGFHAINLRENHERHEAMEFGAVIFTGLNVDRVCQAVEYLISTKIDVVCSDWYLRENVSETVAKIILSYVDKVNAEIWRK